MAAVVVFGVADIVVAVTAVLAVILVLIVVVVFLDVDLIVAVTADG